jgi:hypothetical protein
MTKPTKRKQTLKTLLRFLQNETLKRRVSEVSNLWHSREHDVPRKPGVYFLIAKPGINFQYPAGRSPVYYIGKASSLWKRVVNQHLKHHTHVKNNRRNGDYIYEARHEYGGVYGGRYCFILTWPGMTSTRLERMLIRAFIKEFHAPPVANGAGAWGWLKCGEN